MHRRIICEADTTCCQVWQWHKGRQARAPLSCQAALRLRLFSTVPGGSSSSGVLVQQAGKGAPALGCDDHALLLVRWLRLGSVCGRRGARQLSWSAHDRPARLSPPALKRTRADQSAPQSADHLETLSAPVTSMASSPSAAMVTFEAEGDARHADGAAAGHPTATRRAYTGVGESRTGVALIGCHRRAETGANFCVTTFGRYKFQRNVCNSR